MEKKEYLEADPLLGAAHDSLKEGHVPHLLTPEEWADIEQEARAYSIADRLVEMRVQAGITQKQMAEALNCRQPRVSEIESTPNDKMSMKSITRYVEITGRGIDVKLQDGKKFVLRPAPKRSKREHAVACA